MHIDDLDWRKLSATVKINVLAMDSTVEHNLLLECDELVKAIKSGASKDECLEIINNNF